MVERAPGTNVTNQAEKRARIRSGLFSTAIQPGRLAKGLLDLIYPARCAGCQRVGAELCPRCARAIEALPYPDEVHPLTGLADIQATALHDGIIREAVQALKYENARGLAVPLGLRLSHQLARQKWTIDIIIPVPLHTTRLKERGYNQSQLLGEHVSNQTGLICQPDGLRRERNTHSQVTMNAAERLTNVQNAFAADPPQVDQKRILLIDDVYTTGATLTACAEALLSAGAAAVYGLTVTTASL